MSLARRIFDGFLGKRDKDEEPPHGAEPPKAGKAMPPPPKVLRAETPPHNLPHADRRSDSQTFHVSAPPLTVASPPPDAAVRAEAEPQSPGHMRLTPLRPSGAEGQVPKAAAEDPLRHSQTIRVSPSDLHAVAGGAAPSPTLKSEDMRRSQTIRVNPPHAAAPGPVEIPSLKRVHLHSEAEPVPPRGVELPVQALLMALPPSLRGPAWTPGNLPQGSLFMDPEQLRKQLAEGRVSMSAEEARRYLPEGWLDADVLGDVDLDLAEVMAATPIELIPVPPSRQPRAAAVEALPATAETGAAAEAVAQVPCAVILAALPGPLRGPAWREEGMPDGTVPLAKDLLLEKLRSGRVSLDIEAVAAALPQGWVAPGARGEVNLDLPAVVGALPPEWLQSTSEEDQEVAAVQAMANLFAPAMAAAPAPRTPPPSSPPGVDTPTIQPPPAELDRVFVPARLVLQALPQAMRGPAWQAEGPTGAVVSVPRDQLLRQLAMGRVELTLDQARAQLPDGMLSTDAQGTFALDLATVVAAVPAELIQISSEMDHDAVAVAAMRDLFTTTVAKRADAPIPRAEPTAAALTPRAEPAAAALTPRAEPTAAAPMPLPSGTVSIPCRAILSMLPAALRGPSWRAEGFPELLIDLPKADVLTQLAAGNVTASVSLLHGKIPAGWLAAGASGNVALNLAEVVAAVPPEMMAVQDDMADDVVAAAQLGRLFVSAAPLATRAVPVVPEALSTVAVALSAPVEAISAEEAKTGVPVVTAPAVPEALPAAPVEAISTEEAKTAVPVVTAPAVPEALPIVPAEAAATPSPTRLATPATADREERPVARPALSALLETEEAEDFQPDLLSEWSGVEESLERAPHGIDLNVARAAELIHLPGVGETRAQAIIAHRNAHGPFKSIYGLADVSGVGPALFRRMTGLSVRKRVNRHAVMEHFLTLSADQKPLLFRVVDAIRAEFSASGAVLTNLAGMPLAVSGTMKDANQYAALGSRFFFRARRHLQKFVARASDCVILPGSTPPLLLLSSGDVVVILTLTGSGVLQKRLNRARRAMREIGWLLSRRAVVLRV